MRSHRNFQYLGVRVSTFEDSYEFYLLSSNDSWDVFHETNIVSIVKDGKHNVLFNVEAIELLDANGETVLRMNLTTMGVGTIIDKPVNTMRYFPNATQTIGRGRYIHPEIIDDWVWRLEEIDQGIEE